jgi:hypothetical protein
MLTKGAFLISGDMGDCLELGQRFLFRKKGRKLYYMLSGIGLDVDPRGRSNPLPHHHYFLGSKHSWTVGITSGSNSLFPSSVLTIYSFLTIILFNYFKLASYLHNAY